jgi:hypothetical protein
MALKASMDPRIASVVPPFCKTAFASLKIKVYLSAGFMSLVLQMSRLTDNSIEALSLTNA